jgi:5-methylcytosine-specific restriction endonuclease McrA
MGRKRKSKRAAKAKRGKGKRVRSKRSYRQNRRQDPTYIKWRNDVKDRDDHCCQWPNCGSKRRIQVHHIKTWAAHPGLRFVMANGITLCERCHESIKGKEVHYEAFFLKILEYKMINKLRQRRA